MVCGLVQDKEVRLHDKHIGQRHTLELSARELAERLVEVRYVELAKDGLAACLVVPGVLVLHSVENLLQPRRARRAHASLVLTYQIGGLIAVPEASLQHRELHGIVGRLLQISDAQAVVIHHLPRVGTVLATQDIQQRALPSAVAGYETSLLPLRHTEGDVGKERLVAHATRQALHL